VVFRLAIASLCGLNGIIHLGASIRARQYVPGLVTGMLLYLPLAVIAYVLYAQAGPLTAWRGIASFFLSLVFQAVPMVYLALAYARKRA
jgi:hypothetical protein